ncbi:MAG TPA: MFS transporter [Thermomicrobiales bacterium]|nr:MFS transporter [Thermomicrobiales bacterium]
MSGEWIGNEPRAAPASLAAPGQAWKRPFMALEVRDFRRLWISLLPWTIAVQMGMVTTGYVAYDISGLATAVGIVSLGWGLPMLTFGLFGGVVADRFPKRRTLVLTQSLMGLSALITAALVLTGVVQIWHLVLVSVLQGTGFAFGMPSLQAFIAQLVPRERLGQAIALNSAGMNFSRVVGPAMAGALIAWPLVGAGGVFLITTLMYVAVVVNLLRIPHSGAPVPMAEGVARPAPLKSLIEGLGYLRRTSILFTLLALSFAPVLLGMPYQQLMPVFAEDVFNVGPQGLGILLTVNGIGALIGSLVVASMATFRRRGLLQMVMGVTFGLGVAVFGFAQSFTIGLGALLVVGLVSSAYMTLTSTLVMHYAEPAYHGRVMSVYMLTFSAMPLGVVPFGILSDRYGAPVTIGIGGLVLAVIIALVGALHPTYRRIE